MKDFKPIEQTAESVEKAAKVAEGRMTFIQEFLQKKYGFGILFFVLIVVGIVAGVKIYNQGKEDGSESSKEQIISLNNSLANRNLEIVTSNRNYNDYKSLYDDCINKSTNLNLEEEVRKALEKSDRLEKILERKILSTEKQTSDINSILPLKK